MVYSPLGELETNQDQVNIYGVVVDASLPYKTANNKYVCTIKVIDQSHHTLGTEARDSYKFINCIFHGKRIEDCPQIRCIGDTIRIHRASVKEHGSQKQLHVNVVFNSSWVLFGCEDIDDEMSDGEGNENGGNKYERKYKPYRFSGKNHSFDGQIEKAILDQIRGWARSYLNENTVIHKSSYTPLREVRNITEKRDIDLLVKIMRVFEKDEMSYEIKIKDLSGDSSWIMTVNKLKFSEFNPGEIYRIRSVVAERTTERNVITCKSTTNILRFSKDSLIYRELDIDVKEDVEDDPN